MSLSRYNAAQKTWATVAEKKTDAAGRTPDFLPATYLTFLTQPYFESQKQQSFYPFVEVVLMERASAECSRGSFYFHY